MEWAGPEPVLKSEELDGDPYLPDFTQLGSQIFLHTPAEESPSDPVPSQVQPDLIVVCSWMGAKSKYISKYLKPYQTRYPRSPILLLRQPGADLIWRPRWLQLINIRPAVSVIRSLVDRKKPAKPTVLFHVFSNGGSYTACQFADAYRISSPDGNELLPISALVLDSTPSRPSARRAHTALCESLPKSGPLRTLGEAAVWTYLGFSKSVDLIQGGEDITTSLRKRLNDPHSAFMQGSLKRLYIYSQVDKLIPAADVEAHAEEAMEIIGKNRVQLEDFVSSRHVGHVMLDGEKYWTLIDMLWKEMTHDAL